MTTRLNDPNTSAVCMIMQRLHAQDPADLLIKAGAEHVCIPAEFDPTRRAVTHHMVDGRREEFWRDPRQLDAELLFPERLSRETLDRFKGPESGLGAHGYQAQYQQQAVSFEGGLFKRGDWRVWPPRRQDGNRLRGPHGTAPAYPPPR